MSLKEVKAKIKLILTEKRVAQVEAINRYYATLAINYFLQVQKPGINKPGKFWFNHTAQAAVRMFARSYHEGKDYGWFISHGVDYGVYLTLANDRRNDALTPIIRRFAGRYFQDIVRLFGG